MRIKELYKPGALASADLGESLSEAAEKMTANEVGALAVMNDGRFVGILSERDLVVAMTDEADPQETQIRDYMTSDPLTVEPTTRPRMSSIGGWRPGYGTCRLRRTRCSSEWCLCATSWPWRSGPRPSLPS